MLNDWYFERQSAARPLAPLNQTTADFNYVLQQAREAVDCGERFRVRPAPDSSDSERRELAAAGDVEFCA